MFRFHCVSGCLLSCLLALPLSAVAGTDPAPAVASERAYVETSYLIAPRMVGDFALVETRYDPQNKYSGPQFRYVAAAHPEVRIDVFVYPAGRMPAEQAITMGMRAFRADLDGTLSAGSYTQLRIHEDTSFDLRLPGTAPSMATDPDDPYASLILEATSAAAGPVGRRLRMSIQLPPDIPMYSVGYLFYRQLYFFKVRASVAQHHIDDTVNFTALADHAVRTLLPAIEAAHLGDCASSTINLSADATAADIAHQLIAQITEQQGYNCHGSTAAIGLETKSQHAEVVEIHYEPHEWRSE